MSKKNYIVIAKAFAEHVTGIPSQDYTLKAIAETLADEFKKDNAAFDKARFLSACGVE